MLGAGADGEWVGAIYHFQGSSRVLFLINAAIFIAPPVVKRHWSSEAREQLKALTCIEEKPFSIINLRASSVLCEHLQGHIRVRIPISHVRAPHGCLEPPPGIQNPGGKENLGKFKMGGTGCCGPVVVLLETLWRRLLD